MTRRAEDLLREALRLDVRERAVLAAELLASVDGAPALDVDAAWAAEIQRREERALSGQTAFLDWSEVHAELAKKHEQPG